MAWPIDEGVSRRTSALICKRAALAANASATGSRPPCRARALPGDGRSPYATSSGCARARSAACRRPSSAERRTRLGALAALWRGSLPAFSGPLVAASWAAQRVLRLGPAGGPAATRLRPSPLTFGQLCVTRMLQHAYELGLEQPCWCLPRAHATAVLAPRSARATPPGPRQYTLSV